MNWLFDLEEWKSLKMMETVFMEDLNKINEVILKDNRREIGDNKVDNTKVVFFFLKRE